MLHKYNTDRIVHGPDIVDADGSVEHPVFIPADAERDRRFPRLRGRGAWPLLACDNDTECTKKTDEMCKDAGKCGVQTDTVKITKHADGTKTCSGKCKCGCNLNGCPEALIECEPNRR
jgi:hypothetical protein